jgi:electron transfer flavoprotein alpha subunit
MLKRVICGRLSLRNVGNKRHASIKAIVLAESEGPNILPSTLSVATAANKISSNVTLFVISESSESSEKLSTVAKSIQGVNEVLLLESFNVKFTAESLAFLLSNLIKDKGFTHILATSSNYGKNFIPRLGAIFDSSPITEVIKVVDDQTFKRPIYAGNAIATVKMSDPIKVFTFHPNFDSFILL